MDLYDTVRIGEREGRVMLWDCQRKDVTVGDKVCDYYGAPNYSVAMREGGFVNAVDNAIVSWTDEPTEVELVDKYGDLFDPENPLGLIGDEPGAGQEPYFFD